MTMDNLKAGVFLFVVCFWKPYALCHPCDRPCDSSQPMVCEYEFTLEWYSTMSKACYDCPLVMSDCYREHCIAANGVARAVTVVNRQLPGPTISVCYLDTIVVKLNNLLDNNEGTAIHWHGIYQRGTQWMDGVPMLTQCPIPSQSTFTYEFQANPSGTHWWHAHAGFQRSDGVAGSIVVKAPAESNPHASLYDVDNSNFTLMIGDWLHQSTMSKYVQHHHSDGSNKGESILINGRGIFQNFTTNGSTYNTPLTELAVKQGMRYRIRIINGAVVFCPFEITIDSHIITVIATDGVDVSPLNVTSLVVHGGERFDFVVAANQEVGQYFMNVQGLADCSNNSQQALLKYEGAEEGQVPSSSLENAGRETQLNPLNKIEGDEVVYVTALSTINELDERLKGDPDDVFFLGFDFKQVDNPKYHDPDLYPISLVPRNNHLYTPQINNVTWSSPHSPILTQPGDVDDASLCDTTTGKNVPNTTFAACSHVIDIDKNRLVELVVFDEGVTFDAGHPMHLHGQHFAVVAMNKIATEISMNSVKELYNSGSIEHNLDRAVMKDTVIIPDGGYVVLRFYSDNPGVWLFHCHLSFHVEAGMSMAFRIGNPDDVEGIPSTLPKCGDWSPNDISVSGNHKAKLCSSCFTTICLFFLLLFTFQLLTK